MTFASHAFRSFANQVQSTWLLLAPFFTSENDVFFYRFLNGFGYPSGDPNGSLFFCLRTLGPPKSTQVSIFCILDLPKEAKSRSQERKTLATSMFHRFWIDLGTKKGCLFEVKSMKIHWFLKENVKIAFVRKRFLLGTSRGPF